MTSKNVDHAIDAGNAAVVVHQHQHLPRPVSVGDTETAQRLFGFPHKRTNYTAIGVTVTELPSGRFVVLVADVEAALRARGIAPAVAPLEQHGETATLARSGLRMIGGAK